jgi:hypothetical protein
VTLNEWHDTSLFCGHVALIFEASRLIFVRPHLYIHQKRALLLSYLFNPVFILVFEIQEHYDFIERLVHQGGFLNRTSSHRFLFSYQKMADAVSGWLSRRISSFDYLLLLNLFGGRTFADFSQYPVFPWVVSPELEARDLKLPMGQLAQKRARHFENTFLDSDPQYFYGCHYSCPGVVFWFMTRLPPFTFFLWDLNEGWDDSQRMFTSIMDCWSSASQTNQTDLKEPIPQVFSLPEMYINPCKLPLPRGSVLLPMWSLESPHLFVAMMRKSLERAERLNDWIDLIFGYKQTGDEARNAKNLFLPSSYHSCTAEFMAIDPIAFADQVINFGQCPIQLLHRPHPERPSLEPSDIRSLEGQIAVTPYEPRNPLLIRPFTISGNATVVPIGAYAIPPSCEWFIAVEKGVVVVRRQPDNELMFERHFGYALHANVSCDGLFVAISFLNGVVGLFQLVHANKIPSDLSLVWRFRFFEDVVGFSILSQDFLVAVAFRDRIAVHNFATGFLHRELLCDDQPISHFYDDFDGGLTVLFRNRVVQFSVNGDKLTELTFPNSLTCAIVVGYDFRFDGRLLVVGDVTGTLSFCIVVDSFELKMIFDRKVLNRKCASLCYDTETRTLWCCDDRGNVVKVDLQERRRTGKCQFCSSAMITKCVSCQAPMCEACGIGARCPKCRSQNEPPVFHF